MTPGKGPEGPGGADNDVVSVNPAADVTDGLYRVRAGGGAGWGTVLVEWLLVL